MSIKFNIHRTNGIVELAASFLEIHILCTQLPNLITEDANVIPERKHFRIQFAERPG